MVGNELHVVDFQSNKKSIGFSTQIRYGQEGRQTPIPILFIGDRGGAKTKGFNRYDGKVRSKCNIVKTQLCVLQMR